MKRIIISAFVLVSLIGMNSCKKCSTCTFQDPVQGTLKSEDVCQKGNAYKHSMDLYKENGWVCTEK
ncbi:MAG: hypothetical protein CL840_10850 [Crocinitomicaceae bacterium]|nr:hypothetical protein [Crocinitomicaceae bacterium]